MNRRRVTAQEIFQSVCLNTNWNVHFSKHGPPDVTGSPTEQAVLTSELESFSTTPTPVLPQHKPHARMILWVWIGAALLVGSVVVVLASIALYRRRIRLALQTVLPLSRRSDQTCISSKLISSQHLDAINFGPRRFTYLELKLATNDFSQDKLLGRGGFGSVYQGAIPGSANQNDTTPVAVKRMAKNSKQGEREFHAEVLSIGRLRHRNLVSLLGWCHERHELLLVYDFMAKGSLDQHLYHELGYPPLPWPSRFQILQGIASALDYLHSGWEKCILHRDIKPSNVLLDSHMTARLGDFGLARLAGHTLVSDRTPASRVSKGSNVGGTLGYMAPEVIMYGKLTKKADVYSFGMVILEVVCGRRPPGFHSEDEVESLVESVWSAYQNGDLLDVIDSCLYSFPEMNSTQVQQQVTSVLQLGLLCTLLDPTLRPSTNRLLQGLNGELSTSLPASRMGSPASATSLLSRASSGKNYAVYFGADNFSYAELHDATEGFSDSRILVKGFHGYVYKGSISNRLVAIKSVLPNSLGAEFQDILNRIGRLRHRNIVSPLGWCYEKGGLFLVYEYLEHGLLDKLLDPRNPKPPLPWTTRFKILQGIAAAINYLHSECQENSMLHNAITPRNIALDKDMTPMTPKLTDFDLSSIAETQILPLARTFEPYVAPELKLAGNGSAASVSSDVYSFGVVALEVVYGRSSEGLVQWVWSMHEKLQSWEVLDPYLDGRASQNQEDFDSGEVLHRQQMTRVLRLGMACTLPEPHLRPHSNRLLPALRGDWDVSLPPLFSASTSPLCIATTAESDPLLGGDSTAMSNSDG